LTAGVPVAALFGGPEQSLAESSPVLVTRLFAVPPAELRVRAVPRSGAPPNGLLTAERVVAVGRGLKARADLPLVLRLASSLDAALACSMPIAEDVKWLPKDCYVGRSGQHLSPRLYLAVGISGAPQHLDGVRDAKVVAAVNSDPDAPIFGVADFGIVGDLYEVIPELLAALGDDHETVPSKGGRP
jgi:electron transfer flavoprotein alpha subunit